MSNIVRRESGLPASGGSNYWEDFEARDFAPPLVTIGQPTSSKYKHGEFNFSTGRHEPVLRNVKLIVPKKGRVLFAGSKAACGSDNYYDPSSRFKEPVSRSCQGCFASAWGLDEEKSELARRLKVNDPGEKPLCAESYNLILADENNNPFIITLMKAQLDVVKKKLFSKLRFEFGKHDPYLVSFDMGLEKGSGYNYYVVTFSNFRAVSQDEAPTLRELYQNLSGRAQSVIGEQFEKADQEREAKERQASQEPPPWEGPMDDEIPF